MKAATLFVSLLVATSSAASARASSASGLERLRAALEQVLHDAGGDMAVAVKHVETGQEIHVKGDQAYPMASTFKLPVLVELFNQVDEGRVRLDEMVTLRSDDQHLGSGQLRGFVMPGVVLSVENLAHLMMRVSDNSATDILLGRVGVDNVNRRTRALGIDGIAVNRSCQELILDWVGLDIAETRGKRLEEIEEMLEERETESPNVEAAERFANDLKDTATPLAMNALLERLLRADAAKPDSCRTMMAILKKCETGRSRIRGLLPAKAEVAHKTGTIGGTVNDVGILFLPEERGHVVISVLSKRMKDTEEAEQAIANLARYAYDYFLFTAPQVAEIR